MTKTSKAFEEAARAAADAQVARITKAFPDIRHAAACAHASQAIYAAAAALARGLKADLGEDLAAEVVRVALHEAALITDVSHAYHHKRTAS